MEVVLPDVTGLTSAVESPMKGDPRKPEYPCDERTRGGEGQLAAPCTKLWLIVGRSPHTGFVDDYAMQAPRNGNSECSIEKENKGARNGARGVQRKR